MNGGDIYKQTHGTIQRIFTSNTVTTHNFTTEGGRNDWIVIAQNAVVDISHAIYNTATNIFKALAGGSFFTGSNPQVVPQITTAITPYNSGDPSTKTIKWATSTAAINWGSTSSTCQYSYDNWTTTNTVTCSSSYVPPRPTYGSHTLYLRGTDAHGDISEPTAITYFYDNTVPIDTIVLLLWMNQLARITTLQVI